MDIVGELQPEYTVKHTQYDMSARLPAKVWSLRYSRRAYAVYHPSQEGHPGPGWGAVQDLTHAWDYIGPHDHDYCEITLARGGSAHHVTNDYRGRVGRGDVIVASPGQVHMLEDMQDFEETHLAFLPEWLLNDLDHCLAAEGVVPLFLSSALLRRPLYEKVAHFRLEETEQRLVNSEFSSIEHEAFGPAPSQEILRYSVLKSLMLLARAFMRVEPDIAWYPRRPEIRRAMDIMETSLSNGEVPSVAEIAGRVGLSHKRFDTVFREATGTTPIGYYQNRRVQHAAHLLLNPDNTITDIAHRLCYADTAHMSNAFRRHFGVSPREYRKQYIPSPSEEDSAVYKS
jgi:AraC-like DNA-binding protein